VGTFNLKTFESGEIHRINNFFSNPDIFSTCDILSLRWNDNGGLHNPVVVES